MNRFSIADAWRRRVEEETLFILAAINQTVLTALSKLVAADAVAVDCRWMRQTASGTRFGTQSHAMGTLIGTLTATQLTPNRHPIGMQSACNRHATGMQPAPDRHPTGAFFGWRPWRPFACSLARESGAAGRADAGTGAHACRGVRRTGWRTAGEPLRRCLAIGGRWLRDARGVSPALAQGQRQPSTATVNRQPPIRAGCATSRRFSRAHPGAASEDRPWAGR